MKKTFLTILALMQISNLLLAQKTDDNKNFGKIGLTFSSFGDNFYDQTDLIGSGSYTGNGFFGIGINYLKPLNRFLELETGIDYAYYKFTYNSSPNPNIHYTDTVNISVLSIPIGLRLNFLKYCFINGGIFMDMGIDSQPGIGSNLGLGLKYDFKYGLSAFVNPYFKAHSMISFSANDNHQKLYESGFRFGVMYQF